MSWEVPITVGDEEYPVTFNTEQEPTEADIAAAVAKIQSSRQPVATAPEAQKAEPFVDFSDLFRASGQALATVPTAAPHAYRQLSEGLNNPWERSQGYLSSKAAMDARNAEMEKANQEAAASGDVSTLSRGMRQAAQSIGFSAGAMGSGFMGSTALGAGGRYAASALLGPEAAPVGETIGRVAGGLAAGYGAAYRMAGAQFLDDAREEIDRMFLEHTGRLPNKAEQDEAFSELKPLAEKFGHAEAGPEALGNMVMAGTGKFILGLGKETVKKLASNALAKVGAGAGALATELGGETVTQVEQKRLEDQKRGYLETGAMPAASEAPRTAEEYGEAFKEVAPATLATMGLLGAPAVAYKGIKTLATPATPRDQAIDLEFGGQALPPSPELGLTIQARVEQETQKMADNATKQAEAAQAPALAATIAEVTAVPTAEPQTTAVPTAEPLPVAEETLPPLGEEAPLAQEEPSTGSVPLMVTRDMRQQLYDKGYTKRQVDAMKPQQAHNIITKPEAEVGPVDDVVDSWDKANRHQQGSEWFEGGRANVEVNKALDRAALVGGSDLATHGMAKESTLTGAMKNLLGLLNNNINKNRGGGRLYTAPLAVESGSAAQHAGTTSGGTSYRDGPFILVQSAEASKRGAGIQDMADVHAILVNDANKGQFEAIKKKILAIRPDMIVELMSNADKVASRLTTQAKPAGNPIDAAAHEAATSPLNDKPQPTEAQVTPAQEVLGMEPAELRQPNLQPTTPDALQIERPAEISLRQTPTDSEGVLSVYPRVINGQDKWLVQQGEKRGFGDSIHDTEQEAVEESTREATRRAQRAQTLRDLDAQVEAEAKAKREKEDLGTFTDGMSPMKKGKVVKQLTAEVNYRGTLMTRRDLIQKMVKEGRKVETEEGQRVLSNEKGEYLGEKVLTKAGIDYALHLIAEQAETKSPAIPAPEPRKPRKFAVNPASDFIYEERAEAERQQRQANWMEKQTERITSRDILSADWEKINDDIQRGRRGLTAEKATALVDDAFAQGVIPKSWHENLTAKIAKTKEPANGAFYTVENGRVRTGPAFAGEAPVPSPKAALAEEKRTRGDELPVTDDKAPVTEGDSVVWQDENGVVQEGVLTKLNAGRNNLGEPVSTVALENSATVQVPRRELQPLMASSRGNPVQASRAEAIESLRGHLGKEVSVGVSAVDAINGAAELQGDVPGVQKAWVGTSGEFLADEGLRKAFPQVNKAMTSPDSSRFEGLFSGGRAFVFTDNVGIYEGDIELAAQEGMPPGQAAVQRVITHEALVHRGFYALDKPTRQALLRWGEQNIYEGEMDAKAEEYGVGANWRSDVGSREWLMEEIMAKMIERLKAPPKSGPLKQLWDILASLWRKLTGRSREVTLKDIQDVAKLLRTALELAENNVQTRDGMPIKVEVAKPSMAGERANLPVFMQDSLDAAKAMAAAGKSSADIRAVTGWFPGKYDGKMRWEVPDKAAKFTDLNDRGVWVKNGNRGNSLQGTTLGKLLNHPQLFEAYPDLREVSTIVRFDPSVGESGVFRRSDPRAKGGASIQAQGGTQKSALSTLLHEVQHWIQEKEGFAQGNNPENALNNAKIEANRLTAYLQDKVDAAQEAWRNSTPGEDARLKAEFVKALEEQQAAYELGRQDPLALYRKYAGEIEARDVQARQSFTPEQRKAIEPYSSENIAKENAIVMKDGQPMFSIRPTYTSPLDQTLANTAKAVRLMRDGPPAVPVNLQEVYRKAQVGKSSAMVSLDDLFASAQRENPALTPAQFGEQLQALYNDNGAYLEPAGSAAALSASAEKYNVRNAQGIPATYVMVPDPMPVKASMRLPSATAQKLNGTIRSAQEASGDLTESLQTPIVGRKVHIFPGQAFEARLDAAKQVIDALQANGVSDADLVDAINDPKLHRELGIEQDADMLGLLFAEAMVRDIPKAFDAYEVVRERAGRALGSGALLHSHKRFAHLFLVNGALKQIRQQAEDATKAQANISGDETAKLDKDSRNITSKETQESAEEEMFRLGEEALSKANQTLWQKLKNVVQRLGAATRIFAAKNAAQKPKASLQGVISDKEMAELEAMSPDELQAEVDKLQAEFSMLAKQMLGTTKKPRAAKGKADTGEGELTNAATARIIAQMAERMGAPVDTATAVAALTPEVGTLKAQFEKGIVSALVNKVKAAVTPKAPTGANLNSVMAQITKILADNLNLPENAPAKATLADRALDAFSRTRTNDQTIREVWEAARGKIRELLTQRATEAAGEEITAEEAAAIEAQVEEQLAAIASEVPERMWAKGQAYGVIRDALRELGYDTRAKVLAEPAVARQAVVDKVNSEVAKLPDVDAARWQANQSYLLASIDALIADMQASKARADARSRGEKRKSTFSAADSKTFAAIMENARQRSGDTVPLMPESSTWTKIFSSSPQSQEDKAASMLAYMKEDPALSQLTDEEQEKLAEMFSKTWEAKRKALLEAKVASVLKRREATEKGKQAVKDSIPKLIQAINRGELTDDVLNAEIAEKFGFEKLTEKEIATIERLSKELQQPDLPTHERVGKMDEMAKIVAAKTRMSKAEILSAWWTTAVLSGPKTAFTIGMAFQSGLFEVLSNAVATVARSYYQGKLTDGLNAAKQSITNYFKTFPKAMQLMWQYVVTRDKRLLSQADPAYTQYFDSGQNSPVSVGWKLRQDKRPLVREAGRFMYFVERLLTALDLFNSVTTQQGMLAMAYQLNEKTYDAARVASETDLANYRKKARDLYWGGVEPTEGKDKALLTRQSISLLEAELAKYANVLEDANYTAAQAAMTLTPEGAGGWLYQIIRGAATRQEIAAEKAVREAEQLTGVSPLAKATSKQLAYARRLAVHQMLNLTGLRFARFAGNKLNQSIGFLPLIGLLRLREQTYAGKMKQQAIWRNQSIGTTLAVLGVYMLKAIADEPDDEKRGWGIEGSHENLDRAKANELLTAGRPPYSIRLGGITLNYANWPISSVLAALGAMSDRIKYDPKRWKEMSTGTRAAAAAWAGSMATFDVSALSQLSEIIGKSPYSRDPLEAGLGKVSRVLGNFVGGAIPRLLKDLDAMAPGGAELRKYEGWERFGKEMPVYRRFIGAPMLDIFGKPVEKQPYPWSREYQTAPVEPEYKLLGQLASKGVFPTPADPDHRRVGKGKRSREMTDVEKKRFITNVGEGYRQLMLRHGERLTKMDTEAAKDLLGKLTAKARDRAEWQAVHPATETAP